MNPTPATPLMRLLRRQHGLISLTQAAELGISKSTLSRRTLDGDQPCQRVLPRVYGMFTGDPSELQRACAAALYVGNQAQVTGFAALTLYGVHRLSRAPKVQVLVPKMRCVQSTTFVTVVRVASPPRQRTVQAVPLAPVARAVVDAAASCTSYDDVLSVTSAAIMSRRTTLKAIEEQAAKASSRTTVLLRAALVESRKGSRSVPEAEARALFALAGLPPALVNVPIDVNGERFVPDFGWGWFIVEIDSVEWHLLNAGGWEQTQQRRMRLEAAGYHVLPITPQQLRDFSPEVVAAVKAGYEASVRGR